MENFKQDVAYKDGLIYHQLIQVRGDVHRGGSFTQPFLSRMR